ncbi:MAG: pyridoxamine 5'-phosphate oxidase family protein [Eubacteriales bacterium]|nr:pyridoxamine 5'-phosphate oxidase family protein [Eubacteriales bacterium]
MSKAGDFIKECGVYYVLTVNGDFPAGRPFGGLVELEDGLYISTGKGKDVYEQLKAHPQMQLIALKAGTRSWARVSGIAKECEDVKVKERLLREAPILQKHYPSADVPYFATFRIEVVDAQLC